MALTTTLFQDFSLCNLNMMHLAVGFLAFILHVSGASQVCGLASVINVGNLGLSLKYFSYFFLIFLAF
jgi:hypothetical protein